MHVNVCVLDMGLRYRLNYSSPKADCRVAGLNLGLVFNSHWFDYFCLLKYV